MDAHQESGAPSVPEGLGQEFLEALASVPLQAVDSKVDRKLPKGLGEKSLRLRGTAEETERLHGYLVEQQRAQSASRISSQKSLSCATWQPELGLAVVTSQKGSHWSTHGHFHSKQQMLEAHEALFLMEMGCLELEAGGLPMTLQQAYHTLLEDASLSLQQYTVIASLKRAGYVVKRCSVSKLPQHIVTQATPTPDDRWAPIQLLPSCPLCHHPSPPASPHQSVCVLEVFQPRGVYRKTSPGPPACRVWVASPRDPFPSPHLLSQLSPPAPLRCCVVEGSSISYYTLTQGTVPAP